jgi:hypothetical protein
MGSKPHPDDVQASLDIGAPAAADVSAAREAIARPPEPDVLFTWTEAYRHACEVRYVQRLDPHSREAYLQGVERKRGQAAAQRLRADALT